MPDENEALVCVRLKTSHMNVNIVEIVTRVLKAGLGEYGVDIVKVEAGVQWRGYDSESDEAQGR